MDEHNAKLVSADMKKRWKPRRPTSSAARSRWPTTWPTTPASTDGASAVHAAWAVRMTGISKRFGAVRPMKMST